MRALFFVIGVILFSAPTLASEAIQIDLSKPTIAEQQRLVIKTISDDPKYSEMQKTDRDTVQATLLEISDALVGGKSLASLNLESRREIELKQQTVNNLLAKAFRDSKMVCTKEAVIGSNMLKRLCKTAAARKRDNDTVRDNELKVSK
jgi:hypothetical protein